MFLRWHFDKVSASEYLGAFQISKNPAANLTSKTVPPTARQ